MAGPSQVPMDLGTPKAIKWHPPRKLRFKRKASHGICGGFFRRDQGGIFEGEQALATPNRFGKMNSAGFAMPRGNHISNIFGLARDWGDWPIA